MEENEKCPICKGEQFLKSRETTISGFRYVFYKRCECMKKKPGGKAKHKNPFNEEGDKNIAT